MTRTQAGRPHTSDDDETLISSVVQRVGPRRHEPLLHPVPWINFIGRWRRKQTLQDLGAPGRHVVWRGGGALFMLVPVMAAESCQFSFVHHGNCNLERRQDENRDEDRPRRWGGSGGNAERRMTLHGSFLKLRGGTTPS